MNYKKAGLLALLAALVAAFFALNLERYLSLDYLKQSQSAFADFHAHRPVQIALAYFAIYVAVTALSIPGAAVLTLAGGAIFGLGWGTLIVSFAASAGATLAFLSARYVLRASVESRFGSRLS